MEDCDGLSVVPTLAINGDIMSYSGPADRDDGNESSFQPFCKTMLMEKIRTRSKSALLNSKQRCRRHYLC